MDNMDNTGNTEKVKKARKPRQPKQSSMPSSVPSSMPSSMPSSVPSTPCTTETNNIDSSIIESIHNQPIETKNNSCTSKPLEIGKPKKIIVKRGNAKKESTPTIKDSSLDAILNQLDIQPAQPIPPLLHMQLPPVVDNTNIIKLSSGVETSTPITHIYHISDIHIQLYKRHQEYREVFQRVYNYLISEKTAAGIPASRNRDIPFIIVLTGDILHSKADLSPECIQLTYSFIKTLASIMPVVLIAGNHDININNRDRLDSLTPILADLPAVAPVFYLLESGIYQLGNVLFYHSSILDSKIVIQPRIPISQEHEQGHEYVHIGLYHGRVNGAVYFNGMECRDAESSNSTSTSPSGNKTITPSAFADYDITLLGDIHKHQFMTPTIAYAGSLIQQNIGEDIRGHGLIKWSLAEKSGMHVEIPNDWSYVNIHIDNKKASYLCTAANGIHAGDCPLTKNISLRILYRNTPESYLADYITLMKMNHNVVDFRWNYDESHATNTSDITMENIGISANAGTDIREREREREIERQSQRNRTSLVDITSPEVQFSYLADIIRENYPEISPSDLSAIKLINQEQNDQLRATTKQFNIQSFNGHYKLLRLEFSNLFSFGESNVIEFREFQGIVGIIAANHLGKSSILDIIVYTLFDEFTRKGSTKDIININRDDFSIQMELQIGEWIYTIKKTGQRTKLGASVQVRFLRKHYKTGVIERLEEDSAIKTKEKISEYFGCYEDIIHTSFSIQHDNACFIDSTNVKRKEELERIMRFEIVRKLYELVNQKFNKDKAVYEHIKKKVNSDELVRLKKEKTRLAKLLETIQSDREYARARIRNLHQAILEESGKLTLQAECDAFLADIENNNQDENATVELLASLEEELLDNEAKLEDLKSSNPLSTMPLSAPDELKKQEAEHSKIITETNKKMKTISQSLEKLYKTRKPINTKLDTGITLDEYYKRNILAKERLETELAAANHAIAELRALEALNLARQEQILQIEKQKTRLPAQLQAILDKAVEDGVDIEYMKEVYHDALEAFINHLPKSYTNPCAWSKYLESTEYVALSTAARDYFLYLELSQYHPSQSSQSSQFSQSTISKAGINQSQLENEFAITKTHITTKLPLEETKRNTLTSKLATLNSQIRLVESDIANQATNTKLDEEILALQTKRTRYETRIETANGELQNIRNRTSQLVEIDKLELASRRLAMEIKEAVSILEQFEKYRTQIEANKPIQARITALKAELAEFEEVNQLVETRLQKEQTTHTEIISKLEQMKRDTLEGRDLEAKLHLLEIYRFSLKELPYILLGKIQPLLERKVNDLLAITTDFSVRFDMSESKIDIYLDRAIYKDKSRAILINNASGFERFMASLAIRLALLELSNLPKINFIAIDEGWSSFDTHNINNVSLILDYLTSKFDFVLTISHLIQIKEHCDMQISLRRDERGFSKIIY